MFSESSPCLLVQHGSCSTTQQSACGTLGKHFTTPFSQPDAAPDCIYDRPGPRFWCKNLGFKNGFEIGFGYHFHFVTCANYPFSDCFQCKKSKAISKANFKAVFKAKIFAPESGPRKSSSRLGENLFAKPRVCVRARVRFSPNLEDDFSALLVKSKDGCGRFRDRVLRRCRRVVMLIIIALGRSDLDRISASLAIA